VHVEHPQTPLLSRSLSQSLSSSRSRFRAACATSFSASCLSNTGLSPAASSSRSGSSTSGSSGITSKVSSFISSICSERLAAAARCASVSASPASTMHCKSGNRHGDDCQIARGTCKHHIGLRLCKGISDRQVGDWLGGRPPSSQASHFRISTTQRSEFGRQRAIGKFLSKCSDVERGYGRVPPARNVQFTFPEQLGSSRGRGGRAGARSSIV